MRRELRGRCPSGTCFNRQSDTWRGGEKRLGGNQKQNAQKHKSREEQTVMWKKIL